jgi:hypothetical protein
VIVEFANSIAAFCGIYRTHSQLHRSSFNSTWARDPTPLKVHPHHLTPGPYT